MSRCLYSIRDIKAETFMIIFEASTDAEAVRSIVDELGSEHSRLAKHPEDYQLFCLGVWHKTRGGQIDAVTPVLVCDVSSLVEVSRG